MYRKAPTDKELEAACITLDEWIGDPVQVWPDNALPVRVLLAMRTQWRTGMSGRTGLDYSALPEIWRRLKVPPADRDEVFEALQHLELAALEAMHED